MSAVVVTNQKVKQAITFEEFYIQTTDVGKVRRFIGSVEALGVELYSLQYSGFARNVLGEIREYTSMHVTQLSDSKMFLASCANGVGYVPVEHAQPISRNRSPVKVFPKWKVTFKCNSNFGVV